MVARQAPHDHWGAMSRRKRSHQSHGSPSRPRFWGKHAVAAALDNPDRQILRAYATREAAEFMQFHKDLPVTLADVADLGRLVPHDAPHQGVVIELEALEDVWLGDILADAPERAVLLVLDQVTDPHNVGAILRSAAAFGAVGIVTQDRHSPPESGALAKAASGALERVPWARVVNLARALEEIGEAGFWRIGLAGEAQTDLKEALGPPRVALVLGAEGPGLRPNTREHCDALAKLPISSDVESLNVSNAAAVALYAASAG
jgi:23S rRNA (guanosine2251-2'-O)-methyltransferase